MVLEQEARLNVCAYLFKDWWFSLQMWTVWANQDVCVFCDRTACKVFRTATTLRESLAVSGNDDLETQRNSPMISVTHNRRFMETSDSFPIFICQFAGERPSKWSICTEWEWRIWCRKFVQHIRWDMDQEQFPSNKNAGHFSPLGIVRDIHYHRFNVLQIQTQMAEFQVLLENNLSYFVC